ncbi:hypothetical protein [Lactonifactor longoviformis]|uniref:Uncharacterized protein n=1 Tax=Lactonifactor longoviformis DSM 17459 TaxID=1122155 RepID=A0A1M5BQX5_9CLOT|nr:hypothetical protein [Lactonifactor longoviformis]SHF44637.1 hypothetical protein SAMN02745158_03766 [Lactonifactor longoviformis DSM 17459]
MNKRKTGTENQFRVIQEPGEVEIPRQKAKMYQFMKSKKKGRRK